MKISSSFWFEEVRRSEWVVESRLRVHRLHSWNVLWSAEDVRIRADLVATERSAEETWVPASGLNTTYQLRIAAHSRYSAYEHTWNMITRQSRIANNAMLRPMNQQRVR